MRFIDIAKENPTKNIGQLERIHSRTKFRTITVDLTPRVIGALEKASKEYDSESKTIASLAIEEWLQERGFLGERAG